MEMFMIAFSPMYDIFFFLKKIKEENTENGYKRRLFYMYKVYTNYKRSDFSDSENALEAT